MNPTESRPGATVTHGSESKRQRTASKLFIALWHTNTERDSQVARDLPCEEHLCRWQREKLGGQQVLLPQPGREKGEGYELRVLPSAGASPERFVLSGP